ncbi:hypothetical protein ACJZ2D_002699 [Fusarium nematophilum]
MSQAVRRFAQIVRLKPQYLAEYRDVHARTPIWKCWKEKKTDKGTPGTDSIFYDDQSHVLFASFKYVGSDYKADMARMAENPRVREWWKMTDAWQESLVPGAVSSEAGEPSWWKPVEEIIYPSLERDSDATRGHRPLGCQVHVLQWSVGPRLAPRPRCALSQHDGFCVPISRRPRFRTGPSVYPAEALTTNSATATTSIAVLRFSLLVSPQEPRLYSHGTHPGGFASQKLGRRFLARDRGSVFKLLWHMFQGPRSLPPPPGIGDESYRGGSLRDSTIPPVEAQIWALQDNPGVSPLETLLAP